MSKQRFLRVLIFGGMLSLLAVGRSLGAHIGSVTSTATEIVGEEPKAWSYQYDVKNGVASPNEIGLVSVSKSNNGPAVNKDKPYFWSFKDQGFNMYWSASGLFADQIDPGDTKTFVALSHGPPIKESVSTTDDADPSQTQYYAMQDAPGAWPNKQLSMTNTPGGTGVFNESTGLWDYGFRLQALSDGVNNGILVFGQDVPLTNLSFSDSQWEFEHVGFEPQHPSLSGD